jgi:hypothetical protein
MNLLSAVCRATGHKINKKIRKEKTNLIYRYCEMGHDLRKYWSLPATCKKVYIKIY